MDTIVTIVTININEEAARANGQPIDRELYSVSPYARWFNETCLGWNRIPENNLLYLHCQQNYANELLRSRGYLFLNEVYDILGIPRTKAGQVIGWIFDTDNPVGDNYVDFGLLDTRHENFINGYEKSVLLDFNVDGMILDRI